MLFHADRQMDGHKHLTKLIVTFPEFCKRTKNECFWALSIVYCLKKSEDKQTVSRIGGIYAYFVFLDQIVLGCTNLGGGEQDM